MHCATKGKEDKAECLYATHFKASMTVSLQVHHHSGPAASAEFSLQVSGRDLSSQTIRRNGGSTAGNGSTLFHHHSQSSQCWQHTYRKKFNG